MVSVLQLPHQLVCQFAGTIILYLLAQDLVLNFIKLSRCCTHIPVHRALVALTGLCHRPSRLTCKYLEVQHYDIIRMHSLSKLVNLSPEALQIVLRFTGTFLIEFDYRTVITREIYGTGVSLNMLG